jgi:hypothetical protein
MDNTSITFYRRRIRESGLSRILRTLGATAYLESLAMSCGFYFILSSTCLLIPRRIQPANDWHEVYTPAKSVTVGGHFFLYDTLHSTEVGRRFDIIRPGTTNQHHSSAQLTLSAMMVYMVTRGPQSKQLVFFLVFFQ